MKEFVKQTKEKYARSQSCGIAVFTDFLSEQKQHAVKRHVDANAALWGGADFAERKMACFGKAEQFPLCIVRITSAAAKFSSQISHRDVLGAIIALGVERSKIGDIFISGNNSYAVLAKSVAQLVVDELFSVGKNSVRTCFADSVPVEFAPTKQRRQFSVESLRADCVVAGLYGLSRSQAMSLFDAEKVFVDGSPCKASKTLCPGEVVSVRGKGKFVFSCQGGLSRKGKTFVEVEMYV